MNRLHLPRQHHPHAPHRRHRLAQGGGDAAGFDGAVVGRDDGAEQAGDGFAPAFAGAGGLAEGEAIADEQGRAGDAQAFEGQRLQRGFEFTLDAVVEHR